MTEQNSQIVPSPEINIVPPNYAFDYLIGDADAAIRFLGPLTSSSRLDPELRIALNDIKNTIKTLKTTVIRMGEEAQENHAKMVEVVRSQRLTGS